MQLLVLLCKKVWIFRLKQLVATDQPTKMYNAKAKNVSFHVLTWLIPFGANRIVLFPPCAACACDLSKSDFVRQQRWGALSSCLRLYSVSSSGGASACGVWDPLLVLCSITSRPFCRRLNCRLIYDYFMKWLKDSRWFSFKLELWNANN